MDLPPPLQPWASSLSLFPRELALSLGPLLRRLSAAMGPMRAPRHADLGEVDGFDGLTRRGTYERLLMSEWLLADEAPDEFLRRAAASEHTFFRLAHPSPAGSGVSVTLFDSGPSQLGRPRIVHIAALIVLARRAEEAGAPFAWGVMQDPEGPLFPGVAPAGVLHLLHARTASEATAGHLEAWRRRIGDWKELDDLWIVGAPRVTRLPEAQRASLLRPSEVLEVGGRRVAVTVVRRAISAELALELPADGDCARLLRDPFRVTVAPPRLASATFSPASNLVFSPTGTKLFARSRLRGIVVYPIPTSPRAGPGRPKLEEAADAGPVVAAGSVGDSLVLATACEDGIDVAYASHRGSLTLAGRYLSTTNEPFRAPNPATPLRSLLLGCPGLPPHVQGLILDAGGALFDMTASHQLLKRASRVSALTITPHGVAFVGQIEPGADWQLAAIGHSPTSIPLKGDASRALFGFGERFSGGKVGVVAIEHSPREWTIRDPQGLHRLLVAPPSTTVVGVTCTSKQREEVGLVILEEDGRTLSFVGRDWNRRLTSAPARIEHAVMSPVAASIAYSTVRGEVFVYSLDHQAHLYRLLRENR